MFQEMSLQKQRKKKHHQPQFVWKSHCLAWAFHLPLKMTSSEIISNCQAVTSSNNSPSQDYSNPDYQTTQ